MAGAPSHLFGSSLNGGTPWGKHQFKTETAKYLSKKYPELNYDIQSVYFDFKEMTYTAYVKPKTTNKEFYVTERSEGLWDNYPHSLWMGEAETICQNILLDSATQGTCKVDMAGSAGLNEVPNPIPLYSEVQKQLFNRMEVRIYFQRNFEDADYLMILQIMKIMKEQRISNDIYFRFNDVSFTLTLDDNLATIEELRKKGMS